MRRRPKDHTILWQDVLRFEDTTGRMRRGPKDDLQAGDNIFVKESFIVARNDESPIPTYFVITKARSQILVVTPHIRAFELGKEYPADQLPDSWTTLHGVVSYIDEDSAEILWLYK